MGPSPPHSPRPRRSTWDRHRGRLRKESDSRAEAPSQAGLRGTGHARPAPVLWAVFRPSVVPSGPHNHVTTDSRSRITFHQAILPGRTLLFWLLK